MKAVILAGGEGTRLRPLTYTTPKSLLPICNRPFLEHQLRLMKAYGISDAMLLTGYLADAFEPFARRMEGEGIHLEVVREEKPLGTAGAVRNVLDRLDDSTIVFNGDVLTDLDLGELIAFHGAAGAAATLSLTPVDDATGYGLVPLAEDSHVEAFVEKPPPEVAAKGGLINAGTYVIEPDALTDIPAGEMWSFERQLFPSLLETGKLVNGLISVAYWLDIGTPDRYLQAHWDVLAGESRATPVGRRTDSLLLDEAAACPDDVGPAVLGRGATIEPGATVERAVLLPEARVSSGAAVRDCVIGAGADVGPGADIAGTLIGPGERVGS